MQSKQTLTPALSRPTGEGERQPAFATIRGRPVLANAAILSPSPLGGERVGVRIPRKRMSRIEPLNLRPRASVLECASPLALLLPRLPTPETRVRPSICSRSLSKRQRTGALQNLAALEKFMVRIPPAGSSRFVPVNLHPRASVLDCASPLALLPPPLLAPETSVRLPICSRPLSKRQRTGALQNLAARRRFIGRGRVL